MDVTRGRVGRGYVRWFTAVAIAFWFLWQAPVGLAEQVPVVPEEKTTVVPEAEKPGKPLWEIGLAGGAAWVPDYPASDENHPIGLVLPYAIYRGRIFRAGDRGGIVRGRFFWGARAEFDVSLGGAFPTDSNRNDARRGMPDLDFLLELGPRLTVTLATIGQDIRVGVELPVRAVFSIDLDQVGYHGVVFNPKLAYNHDNIFNTGVNFRVSAGPTVATEELMDYFYEVDSEFVTPTRPAFDAKAGYLGSEITFSARRKLTDRFSALVALEIGIFKGATNADSPLFRSGVTVSVGFGFTWAMWRSQRRVQE
jgi:outer membrane protein